MTGNPTDPVPEIHVAKGVATLLRSKSQINRDAVEVDGRDTRITVDVGDSSIILEPLIDLGAAERLVLRVAFTDGQRAVFVLVSSPTEVDTRIDVIRREQTIESCQAELTEAQARCSKISPSRFGRTGWLTPTGVIARAIMRCFGTARTANGLVCENGTAYRAERWVLVDMKIKNESNEHPWVPREAFLKGMRSGAVLSGAVEMDGAQIAPSEVGHVFVEVEPPSNDEPFVLELRDAAGRGITIPKLNVSAQESEK